MQGYYCHLCLKSHQLNSAIGKAHYEEYKRYSKQQDDEAEERRSKEVKPTEEETRKKLLRAIFGNKENE